MEKIIIHNLLYRNRYILDFTTHEESLVLLHGENGSGKTTLLDLVYYILNENYDSIVNTRFSRLNFEFSNDSSIVFSKDIDQRISCTLIYEDSIIIEDNYLTKTEYDEIKSPNDLRNILNNSSQWISRDNDKDYPFINQHTSEIITDPRSPRVINRIIHDFNLNFRYEFETPITTYLKDLYCNFIKTNRLVRLFDIFNKNERIFPSGKMFHHPRHRTPTDPLRYIKYHLENEIEKATNDSSRIGRKFDSEFFDLLLDQVKGEETSIDSEEESDSIRTILNNQLEEIDSKERELSRLGIYEISTSTETERAIKILQEDDETIEKMYDAIVVFNQGLRKKFSEFDELKRKTSLFNQFLQDHLKGKELIISPRNGFEFETNNGQTIQPWQLSSGEQHIVLLSYYLIFLVSKNSLILIDEPEISLHLKWQRNLIKNIMDISRDRNIKFIIATHSPAITTPYQEDMLKLIVGDQDE